MGTVTTEGEKNAVPARADGFERARLAAGFRLGDWAVDPTLNRLVRNGSSIRVEPKVMDVLVELAAHAGRVVAKEHLIHTLWSREFLAESVLTRAVAELRRLLEDDARAPRYIETIPKRGYRLIAAVTACGADGAAAADPSPRVGNGWLVAAGFALGAALGWLSVRRGRANPRRNR